MGPGDKVTIKYFLHAVPQYDGTRTFRAISIVMYDLKIKAQFDLHTCTDTPKIYCDARCIGML